MKKIYFGILAISVAFISCNQESGSISGSWTAPFENQPQHQYGFTLKDEGTAASINLADKEYEKWEKFGDRLILYGKNDGEKNVKFTDTLRIVSVNDSVMVLKVRNGEEITYTKTATPDKLISDFQTYDCYCFELKDYTALLHINVTNGIAIGDLEYQALEKDSSKGTIKGTMTGDTLKADYTFSSEGLVSVREVIMVKKGNDLVEGFGEMEDKDGKITFLDHAKINFRKGLVFKKTGCL